MYKNLQILAIFCTFCFVESEHTFPSIFSLVYILCTVLLSTAIATTLSGFLRCNLFKILFFYSFNSRSACDSTMIRQRKLLDRGTVKLKYSQYSRSAFPLPMFSEYSGSTFHLSASPQNTLEMHSPFPAIPCSFFHPFPPGPENLIVLK